MGANIHKRAEKEKKNNRINRMKTAKKTESRKNKVESKKEQFFCDLLKKKPILNSIVQNYHHPTCFCRKSAMSLHGS